MIKQRQASLPGFDLKDLVAESIAFIQQHEPQEGYFVGFSGGKDSITLLELCKMAGVKYEACYSCTRIDPPEVVRFIRQNHPNVTWLYPKASFWNMIVKKKPPLRMQRWCCDYLKKAPSDTHPLKHRCMGIRAEESVRRASRPRIDTYRHRTIYKPIFYWPEWAVWEFIESRRLPYPSLYDDGFHRIGCVVCPFILGKSLEPCGRGSNPWPAGLGCGRRLSMPSNAGLRKKGPKACMSKCDMRRQMPIGRRILMDLNRSHDHD